MSDRIIPRCEHDGGQEIFDAFGHTTLGHRVGNIICRAGVDTRAKLKEAMSSKDGCLSLLDLRGLGPVGWAHIVHSVGDPGWSWQDLSDALAERIPDGHMRLGVIGPDGAVEMRPCADWCYACKLQRMRVVEREHTALTLLVERVREYVEITDDDGPTTRRRVLRLLADAPAEPDGRNLADEFIDVTLQRAALAIALHFALTNLSLAPWELRQRALGMAQTAPWPKELVAHPCDDDTPCPGSGCPHDLAFAKLRELEAEIYRDEVAVAALDADGPVER